MSSKEKLQTGQLAPEQVPGLWRIERCTEHQDYVMECLRCHEEVLTTKTEAAYRAGFAAAAVLPATGPLTAEQAARLFIEQHFTTDDASEARLEQCIRDLSVVLARQSQPASTVSGKLREAVIAELYKRHPSLGARSIDEFADFVAALAATGEAQPADDSTFETNRKLRFALDDARAETERLASALRDMQLNWTRFYQVLPDGEYGNLSEMRQASVHAGKALIGEDYAGPDGSNMQQMGGHS